MLIKDLKDFCIACILCGFPFLQGSFSLRNFDGNWFLLGVNFCKQRVNQGLSLNFNLFLEIYLVKHKCQVDSNFSRKVLLDFSVFLLDESKRLSQLTEK